jgi:MoxR-like ATPase
LNERKYTNEGRTYTIPVISFFSASNEIPNFSDPAEKILAALYDRLELKVVTENVESRQERLAVLRDKQTTAIRQTNATITLDELYAMQAEVKAVLVPEAVNELMDDILCELRKKGVKISDRKYFNYYPIAQAGAWLAGRATVIPDDLLALRFYLWSDPAERATIEPVLEHMCHNPLQEKINDIRAMAAETEDEFMAAKDDSGNKALIKFRSEYLRLYQMYCDLLDKAQSDSEKAQLSELLNDLEKSSMAAHEALNFTYAPLDELALLKNFD